MILVKEKRINKEIKKKMKNLYVNTLVPKFQFRNKCGEIVKPINICINL